MHAVVVRVNIADFEASRKDLREKVVPRVSQAPGFVAGYWTRSDDGRGGLSMIICPPEVVSEVRPSTPEERPVRPGVAEVVEGHEGHELEQHDRVESNAKDSAGEERAGKEAENYAQEQVVLVGASHRHRWRQRSSGEYGDRAFRSGARVDAARDHHYRRH